MKHVVATFIPKLLNFEQKQCHISIAQELLNNIKNDPSLLKPLDLAPCYFLLFSKLKKPLQGKRFATIYEIKSESKKELMAIPKSDFRSLSRIGKSVGTSVLYPRGTTLIESK